MHTQSLFKLMIMVIMAGLLLHLLLPWWSGALAAGLVTLIFADRLWNSILAGFLGIGLLWLFAALWIQSGNDGILAGRVAAMPGFSSGFIVFLITLVIGAVMGVLGGLTGYLLQRAVRRPERLVRPAKKVFSAES